MSILANFKGVVYMTNDVLVYGSTYKSPMRISKQYTKQSAKCRIILNNETCLFQKTSVKFLDQMIDQLSGQGIRSDSAKIEAIQKSKQPINVKDPCQFLEMLNHLNKFMPNLCS